jgi:hypothetical protein
MPKRDNSDPFGVARATSRARAEKEAATREVHDVSDRDEAECFQHLVIACYLLGLKVGLGVMPDGMAVYIRLSIPKAAEDDRAGYVAFVVSDEPRTVLNKAVDALEASVQSNYWKPDRFANGKAE